MALRRKQEADTVSASALAQMGICERRVVFEQQRGHCVSEEQVRARRRGTHAHRGFFLEGNLSARASRGPSAMSMRCAVWLARWLRRFRQCFIKLSDCKKRLKTGQGEHDDR